MLLRPRDDYYEGANPTPENVLLVVEVSDSSLRYDRDTKVSLYASHNIPERRGHRVTGSGSQGQVSHYT
jgi:hypothetical protein